MANYDNWIGQEAYDSEGKKVGKVTDLYLDDDSNEPQWVAVKSASLFGSKTYLAPITSASESDEGLQFNVTQDYMKDAPLIDIDGDISAEEEATLRQYYAGSDSDTDTDTVDAGDDGRDTSGPQTDDAMTRSEEQLNINKEVHQTGVARLKKYVVTEQVHTTVPVQKEVVTLEREPITDENRDASMNGAELSEEEHEMTLSEERVVVSKETVPVERVTLKKNIVNDDVEVNDSVQKEKIDLDEE